jgi:hypothetical protein
MDTLKGMLKKLKNQKWRTIPIASDYAVSDMGQVKRITPYKRNREYKGVIPRINSRGYESVHLRCNDGKTRNLQVHRLVMTAFHGESPLQVNHINGFKHDNTLVNLEYVTPQGNRAHAKTVLDAYVKGEKHPNAKITEEAVEAMHDLAKLHNWSYERIGRAFGCTGANVQYIVKGMAWAHKHPGHQELPG